MAYASGKHAIAISDRSGLQFPYNEMVQEWNGMWVHTSEYEPKAPQLMPHEHVPDPQALEHPRPARVAPVTTQMLSSNPFRFTASSSTVTVFEPDHGRSTSDTVRFRDVTGNLFGAAVSEIEDSSGYSITKTDDDFYTFTVSTAPGITGNGGGGFSSAGPATLSN